MRIFRFLRENRHFNDIAIVISTPFDMNEYENRYRYEYEGYEFIGVSQSTNDIVVSRLPIKRRIYRAIVTGDEIIGDIIKPEHPMWNHPNVIRI